MVSLPVVISCSHPSTCPYTAVADTGAQVSVADCFLLGDLGISQRQLQATPAAITLVAGGSMRLLGTITYKVSVGPVTTTECIYISRSPREMVLGAIRAHRICHGMHAASRNKWSASPHSPPGDATSTAALPWITALHRTLFLSVLTTPSQT